MFLREFWPRAERIRRSRERRRFCFCKKCVTDRAVADPFAFEFGQALYARCEPSAAGRQKYRLAPVLFVVRGDDGESAVLIINRHRLLVREFHSEPFGTVNSACQKLFSANRFGKAVIVFDFSAFASALSPAVITVVSRPLRIVYNAAEMPAGPAPIMITSDIQKLSLQNKIKQIFKPYYSYIISVLC